MSRSFLIVLPKEMRSGVAPAASASSISTTEAASKHEPSSRQELEHLRRRIGLHGVEHARVGQRAGELRVVVAHDVEVDDQAGPVLASVAQEFTDALGHGALPTKGSMEASRASGLTGQAAKPPGVSGEESSLRSCDGDTSGVDGLFTRRSCLGLEGETPTARPAMINKPLRCRPLEGQRDQKSPFRRCFKPRPPLRAGFAGFASGCRSLFGTRSSSEPGSCLRDIHPPRANPCLWRLSGLLSGCPPTGTRPQARAKLGRA